MARSATGWDRTINGVLTTSCYVQATVVFSPCCICATSRDRMHPFVWSSRLLLESPGQGLGLSEVTKSCSSKTEDVDEFERYLRRSIVQQQFFCSCGVSDMALEKPNREFFLKYAQVPVTTSWFLNI
ncbi:hypothetical protein Y032_0652g1157 [Ancylostoma ceylanicum]|nr:hypothetical protein Y032_0652g1157 [Ancylostoma ceylanicum]